MSTGPLLTPFGTLKSHTNIVTAIATPHYNSKSMMVSSSRDKSLIVWALHPDPALLTGTPSSPYGHPLRRLNAHNHFVQDVSLSQDGRFALSGSWDHELRLWDLCTSTTNTRFTGHTNDVLSVAFSSDNRLIVSGSRDKTVRIWNTIGECKFTLEGHTEWVSDVSFIPNRTMVVSSSWDSTIKVWDLVQRQAISTFRGHRGYINAMTVSPDGTMCASGGRDGAVLLWDLGEGKMLYDLHVGAIVQALCFSPNRYWICAATEKSIVIWDIEKQVLVQELLPEMHVQFDSKGRLIDEKANHVLPPPAFPVKQNPTSYCTSLAWDAEGITLFTGYSDGVVRVWSFGPNYMDSSIFQ